MEILRQTGSVTICLSYLKLVFSVGCKGIFTGKHSGTAKHQKLKFYATYFDIV